MSYKGFTIVPTEQNQYGNAQVWMGRKYICTCENEQECINFINDLEL